MLFLLMRQEKAAHKSDSEPMGLTILRLPVTRKKQHGEESMLRTNWNAEMPPMVTSSCAAGPVFVACLSLDTGDQWEARWEVQVAARCAPILQPGQPRSAPSTHLLLSVHEQQGGSGGTPSTVIVPRAPQTEARPGSATLVFKENNFSPRRQKQSQLR